MITTVCRARQGLSIKIFGPRVKNTGLRISVVRCKMPRTNSLRQTRARERRTDRIGHCLTSPWRTTSGPRYDSPMQLLTRRRHLFEIHEQDWCPAAIRDGATDYLRFFAAVARQYKHVIPVLGRGLLASRSEAIVDLCSGSGGPWPQLQRGLSVSLPKPIPILLTDLHPNQATTNRPPWAQANVEFVRTPVDATRIPAELTGFRTLFTAFHHFQPQDAQNILRDAVRQGQGIGVFEQTARTPLALIMMLVLPWLALLTAPFIRPFRIDRLFWTWVIPAIPFVLVFDGIVSCLRTYSLPELRALTEDIHVHTTGQDYIWEYGALPSPLSPVGVHYLIGYPAREEADGDMPGHVETGRASISHRL